MISLTLSVVHDDENFHRPYLFLLSGVNIVLRPASREQQWYLKLLVETNFTIAALLGARAVSHAIIDKQNVSSHKADTDSLSSSKKFSILLQRRRGFFCIH